MKLADWRESKGLGRAEVAQRLSATVNTVRRYEIGERLPDQVMMTRIIEMTGGLVTPNDFYDLPTAQVAA